VTGGEAQDKDLHDNLSSRTASTTSVKAVAAIAAKENRTVLSIDIDIGGGPLGADISREAVPARMRHDKTMTGIIITKFDPRYGKSVCQGGPVALRPDRALCDTMEAATPSYDPCEHIRCGSNGSTYASSEHDHPHKAQHTLINVLGYGVGYRTGLPVEERHHKAQHVLTDVLRYGVSQDQTDKDAERRAELTQHREGHEADKDAERRAELTQHREGHELIHPIAVMLIVAQAYIKASDLWWGRYPTPECATTSVMRARDILHVHMPSGEGLTRWPEELLGSRSTLADGMR
jgi:hypothetical protein